MLLASLLRSAARLFRPVGAAVLVSFVLLAGARAQSLAADGFSPAVDGNVFALVVQTDGRIVIGGQFSSVQGFPRANLARLNADGSVDESFDPSPNAPVRALVLEPDGRLLVGGDFTSLRPGGTGAAVARGLLARVNVDGTVDAAFNPNLGGTLLPQVHALLRQANGQIVAGGTFTTAQSNGAAAAVTRNFLARFAANGALDTAFNPNPNALVLALASHVDGKIVVGGGFTSFQPAGDSSATVRNRLARLNANGTLDTEFNPNANNGVTALAVQRDGKIVLGGFFTTLQPIGDSAPSGRQRLARLNVDGTLDSEYIPRADAAVTVLAVAPDGTLLVGGAFTNVWGRGSATLSRSYVARFGPDGSLDADFAPVVNGQVAAVGFQADGRIVIGGYFTRATPAGRTGTVVRNHLARLNADGSLDADFELDAGGRILASVTQSDGKIVVGGTFTSVGGTTHNYLARLNADGSVDEAYRPDFNGRVLALAIQNDGKVVAAGTFTTIGGEPRNYLARLNPNGTIDSEFNPSLDNQAGALAIQGDGKILVGGSFSNVTPARASTSTARANLLRLNADGTLDTAFDPSPNAAVAALFVQSDNKILVGGQFTLFTPGFAANTSATSVSRNNLARLNADGTVDTAFNPSTAARVSAIVAQSDGKVVAGGAFTAVFGTDDINSTTRNRLVRFGTDGKIDTAWNPNANGNVLALALQSDGKLLVGGAFTTLQPNDAATFTLRKYAARLNTDGTVDSTFNLDLSELAGNRVDSIRVQADGRVFVGGAFTSLQPIGAASRVARPGFVRLTAAGGVDSAFNVVAGGATGAVVNALAVQADNKVVAVGNFSDLGGAKTTNIARFNPEGTADPAFSPSLATDGAVNAVIVRPDAAATASQLAGFAWLNRDGTLRAAFAAAATRLSGEINAVAVQADGAVLLGGSFTNLSNTTGGNLVRFSPAGALDLFFNPLPNGAVTAIAVQTDGRILVAGNFTGINGTTRNRLARINTDGTVDVTYDPNANGRINTLVLESDGRALIGGAFTTLTPNLTTTPVARNYLARINADGTVDANYNPNPNSTVNALAIQSDGKLLAGGTFTSVQPNNGTSVVARNGLARFNTDGTLDQNFDPNANASVNALVALPNGQFIVGGGFTSLTPNGGATVARNNLARINSDGAVDAAFNPNPNGAIATLALQADGALLLGGAFTSFQPGATGPTITRNRLARVTSAGAVDVDFNPDVNGAVSALLARPDGTILVGGAFTELQVVGSLVVGGSFNTIGGVNARNLAMLNDNGSVNTTFQPRPDGAVHALLVLPDGKLLAGGEFSNLAGTARARLARFNANGTLDAAFNATVGGAVTALARQADGRILVGLATANGAPATTVVRLNADGSADATFTGPAAAAGAVQRVHGLAVQRDGRVLVLSRTQITGGATYQLARLGTNGAADSSFAPKVLTNVTGNPSLALQADGRIVISGGFATIDGRAVANLARINADGSVDTGFAPAPNGPVSALALQNDGRLMIGGSFSSVGGASRVGLARVGTSDRVTQTLGVGAARNSVTLTRSGPLGELSGVTFERSTDRASWTRLGEGTRVAGSGDWQLTGLTLPASGLFYIRAVGILPGAGTSSGLIELVREFTYANPLGAAPAGSVQVPVTAASQSPAIDPVTGIAARSVVRMVPGEDSVEIIAARASDAAGSVAPGRLVNLSTRGRVGSDSPLILGFAVTGTGARDLLVRAVGPALAGFGVTDALAGANLRIYDSAGVLVASVTGGASASDAIQAAARTGAFPLAAGSADSAALVRLAPGTYTAQVVDARGTGGVGLAEIYDAGGGAESRLANVSSRASTGAGNAALISGFVIGGAAAERVLLRGVGPTLAQFGAAGAVADPAISLYDAAGFELGGNDNWVSSVTDVSAAAQRAGAFALAAGSKDAAVLATLPPGAYTVQVRSATAGAALLEIYDVP